LTICIMSPNYRTRNYRMRLEISVNKKQIPHAGSVCAALLVLLTVTGCLIGYERVGNNSICTSWRGLYRRRGALPYRKEGARRRIPIYGRGRRSHCYPVIPSSVYGRHGQHRVLVASFCDEYGSIRQQRHVLGYVCSVD
jgi:hypothetical protein